jgi:hypothetical protein
MRVVEFYNELKLLLMGGFQVKTKKQFIIILTLLLLILSMVGTSFADGTQLDDTIIVEDRYGDLIGEMSYEEYMKFLYGEYFIVPYNTIPGIIENKRLVFTRYLQSDPRWSSQRLLKGSNTIGSHGCALTSAAMLLDFFGYNDNPLEVNNKLLPYQPENDGNMYWGNVPLAYPAISLVKATIYCGRCI